MNYYEHHIGDYDSATAHLSLLEDAVYRRLISRYYRTEFPLPAEPKAVCRLVRARSKLERDTVADVLQEFFELRADGWHNSRCDAEIARFRERQGDVSEKRENEKERQRRHRVERKQMFSELRPECTGDLFSPPPRRYFLADDESGLYQLMAMELHGQPGQRTVHFFLEAEQGDIGYGWGPMKMLLLPPFAKGAWTGQLNPQHGAPVWAHSVNTAPETMEELRLWAQDVALGRAESGPALNNQPALPQGANDSDH